MHAADLANADFSDHSLSLLRKNLLVDGVATSVGLVLQFLVLLVVARELPGDQYAAYVLASATIAVGEMCSDFGMRMWAVRQYSLGAPVARTLRQSFEVKAVWTSLFLIAVMANSSGRGALLQPVAIALIAFTQPSSDPVLWCFRGREHIFIDSIVTFVWRVSLAIVTGTLAYSGALLLPILMGWLAVNVGRLVLEGIFLARRIPAAVPVHADVVPPEIRLPALLRQIIPVGGAFVLTSLYQRVGVFMLDKMSSSAGVAAYGTAFSLVNVPGFLSVSIAAALFPRMSRATQERASQTAKKTLDTGLILIGTLYAVGAVVGTVCAPWVLGKLLPLRLQSATTVVQVLLPGLYISTLSVFLKYCLNALGRNVFDAAVSAIGIGIFALVLLMGVRGRAAIAAAIAWNVGELAIFVMRGVAIHKDARIPARSLVLAGCGYPVVCLLCYSLARLV